MGVVERLPRLIWRLLHFLPPRLAYGLGLGSLVGRFILLLTTIGRKSGLPRVTPLLYDEIEGKLYVGSARGTRSDWYQNLKADPNVEVEVGSRHFKGRADLISDPRQVADFLEERWKRHPVITSAVFWAQGRGRKPSREQLEDYARGRTLVAITPAAGRDGN